MAIHIYTSTGWKTINWDTLGTTTSYPLYVRDGSGYQYATNAKVYSAGSWKGFLDNISLGNDVVYGDPNYAEISINSNGIVYPTPLGSSYNWNQNSANSGQYEIYAQTTGGISPVYGSALNTWLNLGTTRTWYINDPAPGGNATLYITIRHATTQQTLAEATITLNMSYDQFPI